MRLAKRAEISSGRILVDTQIEFREHGQDMIENVRLDGLVIRPHGILAEDVNFYRQAVFVMAAIA